MPKTPKEIADEAIAKFAMMEHELTQARLITGRHNRAQIDGRGSGPLPYGYKKGPYDSIEIDKAQAKIITIMWELSNQKVSQANIAEELNRRHLKTSWSKPWTASAVQQVMRHALLYTTGIREWATETPSQQWPIILHIQPGAPVQYALPMPNQSGQVTPSATYTNANGQLVSMPLPATSASYVAPDDEPTPDPISESEGTHLYEEYAPGEAPQTTKPKRQRKKAR